MSNICSQPEEDFYTDGKFGVGKILYTDENLTTPLTGYSSFARHSNGKIFALDPSTGEILSFTGSICGGGSSASYKLGNNLNNICANTVTILYTDGDFATGGILYTDTNLLTVQSGYNYVVTADGNIYNLNSTTGVIGNFANICPQGAIGTYILGNGLHKICKGNYSYLYTLEGIKVGAIMFRDIALTTPQTGYKYIADVLTSHIFFLNPSTGEVQSRYAIDCGSAVINGVAALVSAALLTTQLIENISHFNFLNNSASTFRRVIQMVVTDARVKQFNNDLPTGIEINNKVNDIAAMVNETTLFYSIEALSNASLAGFFILDTVTAQIIKKVFRPAFEDEKSKINKEIDSFITNGGYKQDLLLSLNRIN